MLTAGDVVRTKTTHQEGIIGSVDGENVLVMFKQSRKWMTVTDVDRPINCENIAPKDIQRWLNARY